MSTAPNLVFDYVIVGGRTAGCLLANRLSASGTHQVLLIESGGAGRHPWMHIPAGYLYCIDHPRLDWRWRTTPQAGLHGRELLYPRGRALGGCTRTNGMIYMRGQSRDYAQWAQITGDEAWSWPNVLPDFMAHEDHYAGGSAQHGAGGEWRVERQRLQWDLLDAVQSAAQQAGIPTTPDFNGGNNEGVGYFEVNQRRGWRWSAAQAFLDPARSRRNLVVWTRAQALRLQLGRAADGRLRCEGVDVARDVGRSMAPGGRLQGEGSSVHAVRARREVILAAGSIGSTQLLQVSGIGPAEWLQAAGVPVNLDLPGVGANLQDHLQLRTVWRVAGVPTLNAQARSWRGRLGMLMAYALNRSGPLSMAPSQLGVFTRSRPELAWPDVEFHVQPLSLSAFGQPLDAWDAFTASVCALNPTSRGTVRVTSPSAFEPPRISPDYLSTDEDRRVAVDALRLARRLVAQPALAAYRPQELKPGPEKLSDAELLQAAGEVGTTIFHPVGTTRMGRSDDRDAVVDARLRVRGVGGLRIADAGVMPTITSGNTASPVLMIAEKAARWILAD